MHFQTAVEIDPSNVSAANNAAWLMATSPDASLRNGNKALELAEHGDRLAPNNAVIKATLAAALAESGRFEEAATTAEVALQFASGSALLADGIREQVRLHRAGVPSREAHTADQ